MADIGVISAAGIFRRFFRSFAQEANLGGTSNILIEGWLEELSSVELTRRRRSTIKRIVDLFEEVSVVFARPSRTGKRDDLFNHLNRAGRTLVVSTTTLMANSLCDLVEGSLNDHKKFDNAIMALQMLVAGILIQGGIITGVFLASSKLGLDYSDDILGVKTITLIGVLISGVIGSLARSVFDARSGHNIPTNNIELLVSAVARPMLGAILVMFVYLLFLSDLIGNPFPPVAPVSGEFHRGDFFLIGISFAVGFNDTLGLNLIGRISGFLDPDRRSPTHILEEAEEPERVPLDSTDVPTDPPPARGSVAP